MVLQGCVARNAVQHQMGQSSSVPLIQGYKLQWCRVDETQL